MAPSLRQRDSVMGPGEQQAGMILCAALAADCRPARSILREPHNSKRSTPRSFWMMLAACREKRSLVDYKPFWGIELNSDALAAGLWLCRRRMHTGITVSLSRQ